MCGSGIVGLEDDARAHWDTLGTKRLLDIALVLCEHFLDIMVKMKLDLLVSLLNLHAKKRLHKPPTSDHEILGLLAHELLLELGAGRDMHHVIHKQTMKNKLVTHAAHEDSLLTVYRRVSVLLHPSRDEHMPSASCLPGSIDALEKL